MLKTKEWLVMSKLGKMIYLESLYWITYSRWMNQSKVPKLWPLRW